MKILIVNFSDTKGGAARAANRLHLSLLNEKIDSKMFVLDKQGDDLTILTSQTLTRKLTAKIQAKLNTFPLRNNILEAPFSASFSPSFNIAKSINKLKPDIVHLHWINAGMLKIEDLLKIKAPIVWTLHDMWPFTGGCHYSDDCKLYMKSCGRCPILKSNKENDLSKDIFKRKEKTYSKIQNLTIVGLSKWLEECAKSSKLFKNKTVINLPNPINTDIYKPFNKEKAKHNLGLSNDKKYVLFGAMFGTKDKRKGFKELKIAFSLLKSADIELIVFGSNEAKYTQEFGLKTHYFGEIFDNERLMILYNASDVMVVPSLQENLSNVIMESLSCGTPVVGFNIGGNKDLIDHKNNGYLAKPFDSKDLFKGIQWVLKNKNTKELRVNARDKVIQNFDSKIVAKKYMNLYNSIINKKNPS